MLVSMNRLGSETSPYLLQHRNNPVDWYPWGDEALAAAKQQNKPLLVSIGYSACHWCHVMAHESFEDERVAASMNAAFICVKVDREERPDIDAICMDACQAMNGHGGWPLNVFLTPELEPFLAGTYFPPEQRVGAGNVSWPMIIEAVDEAWRERPEKVREQGAQLAEAIARSSARERPAQAGVSKDVVAESVRTLVGSFDRAHGGWGGAPKFPPHCTLEFLLAVAAPDIQAAIPEPDSSAAAADPAGVRGSALDLALTTLQQMAVGGIYDQVGGGFARYAVDATWTVPHFEKMLYDNALLARAYLHGYQLSGEQRLREVCCETLDWAIREMRGEEGGFCSALDADSEGVEGKFYVWSEDELVTVLGELAPAAIAYFGARRHGNFEGANVLEARGPRPEQLTEIRSLLLAARAKRVRPGLDDKRLSSWNALMVMALADAGAVLERADYLDAARACAEFILGRLRDDDGKLLRTWKDGRAHLSAYLEDYAYLLQALLVLYEATFEQRWYLEAVAVADQMIERFGDREQGGFFTTATGEQHLVARRKDLEDAPIPSGNSTAALGLIRLGRLSGDNVYTQWAVGVFALNAQIAERHPGGFGALLQALDLYLAPSREVAVVGEEADGPMTRMLRERFLPHAVIAGAADAELSDTAVALLRERASVDGLAAAYVCENFSCRLPVTTAEQLAELL
jgi:uncharacterized protein